MTTCADASSRECVVTPVSLATTTRAATSTPVAVYHSESKIQKKQLSAQLLLENDLI